MKRRNVPGGLLSLFAVSLTLLLTGIAWGAPASPFPVVFTQPDGDEITVYNRGDEFLRWVESPQGYTLVKNSETKFWEFAVLSGDVLAPSGLVYRDDAVPPSGVEPHLLPKRDESPRFRDRAARTGWPQTPVSGTRKVLVVLVAFQDRNLSTKESDWEEAFFGASGSVARYYKDQSYGKLDVVSARGGKSVVSVTLDANDANDGNHPEGFIDEGDNTTQHRNETAFVSSVVKKAAAKGIDFASFDTNGDGRISPNELCVYLIVGGFESGMDLSPAVGAHAWSSWSDSGEAHIVRAGGKILTNWALNGELYKKGERMPIGVSVHELGHQLCGLPDLYDINNANAGIGGFSVMAGGMYGAKEKESPCTTPVNLDAWSRFFLGWESPASPSEETVTFGVPGNGRIRAVKLQKPGHRKSEYFLAEVRYPTGWDAGLAAFKPFSECGGLLLLHVDEEVGSLTENNFNAFVKGKHQGLVPMEANGPHIMKSKNDEGSCRTLWYKNNPDYVGDGTFSDTSTPNALLYDGSKSGISVSGISSSGTTMTASVSTGMPTPTNMPLPEEDVATPSTDVTGGTPEGDPTPVPQEELPPLGKPNPSDVGMDFETFYEVFGDDAESSFAVLAVDNAESVTYRTPGGVLTIGLESEFALEDGVFYCWLLLAWNREENGWSLAWSDEAEGTPSRHRRDDTTLFVESVFEDGGPFDMDSTVNGFVTAKTLEALFGVLLIDAETTVTPTPGEKGGGCAVGFGPAATLLLLPLVIVCGTRERKGRFLR
jgi:M6 family metalloprotease-like protein